MEVKFESTVNGIIEEWAGHGTVVVTDVQEYRCAVGGK